MWNVLDAKQRSSFAGRLDCVSTNMVLRVIVFALNAAAPLIGVIDPLTGGLVVSTE
jgi:hypothetical protein